MVPGIMMSLYIHMLILLIGLALSGDITWKGMKASQLTPICWGCSRAGYWWNDGSSLDDKVNTNEQNSPPWAIIYEFWSGCLQMLSADVTVTAATASVGCVTQCFATPASSSCSSQLSLCGDLTELPGSLAAGWHWVFIKLYPLYPCTCFPELHFEKQLSETTVPLFKQDDSYYFAAFFSFSY